MKPFTCFAALQLLVAVTATSSESLAQEKSLMPLVIAHRGASGYLPEHTLPATAMAHALGADLIEQDVVLTRDHQVLVIHDLYLDYVTNVRDAFPDRRRDDGHYYVCDFTLEEIKTLVAHERIDPLTQKPLSPSRYPLGKGNFSLATLTEQIELIQGLNHSTGREVGLCVEIKSPAWQRGEGLDISRSVLEILTNHGYKSHDDGAVLQCFDFEECARLRRELKTELPIVQLLNEKVWRLPSGATREQFATEFKGIAEYADAIGPGIDLLNKLTAHANAPKLAEVMELAHGADLRVYCYTLRADAVPRGFGSFGELARTLTGVGVDGFFTDHADKLREVLAK